MDFKVFTTPSFDRETRKLSHKDRNIEVLFSKATQILLKDPFNISRSFDIKKLKDVKDGEGKWRIRLGNYRIRYDIFRNEVVLHTFKDRKDSY